MDAARAHICSQTPPTLGPGHQSGLTPEEGKVNHNQCDFSSSAHSCASCSEALRAVI